MYHTATATVFVFQGFSPSHKTKVRDCVFLSMHIFHKVYSFQKVDCPRETYWRQLDGRDEAQSLLCAAGGRLHVTLRPIW